ncbi:MAG: tRNA (adenosine(37)-N6)-threonylcarbamoyltransferase complex dimerization subunit type 1 TsaB [Bacteroidetes bacterium]|nr:tRNA (adenosine(37)-N6)-threonylcarbamoyltransferase complex dimerization subunit type 1 TsaB [Bacteroidota bacterium]
MALILNIETATTVCSVALARDGVLLSLKEINGDYSHAENLTLFIEEVLSEVGIKIAELDAIAVSKGPGSYTGLRIGVSTAKGLCYSLDKPLIAVNTLQHLSLALSEGEGMDSAGNNPRYYTTDKLNWSTSIINAKEHRKNPTEAESIIWENLRAKKLNHKFRRQHPIGKYIVDFVCVERKLIVEIDGKIHESQLEEDAVRTEQLNELGFKVIRYTNEQVISGIDEVIGSIKVELDAAESFLFSRERHGIDSELTLRNVHSSLSFGEGRGEVLYCPMIDARRMEVYCAIFDAQGNEVKPTTAEIIDEYSFLDILKTNKVVFFGDGSAKCKETFSKNSNAVFIDDVVPSAKDMIKLSEQAYKNKQFEDVAYFEPFYLKDFVAGKKKGAL